MHVDILSSISHKVVKLVTSSTFDTITRHEHEEVNYYSMMAMNPTMNLLIQASKKVDMLLLLTLIVIILSGCPAFAFDEQAVAALVDVKMAQKSSFMEVVTVAGKLSHIEYTQPDVRLEALPSPLPSLAFIEPELKTYGSLKEIAVNHFRRDGAGPGGLIFDLASPGKVRDLLAYQSLLLEGSFNGGWSVALADENLAKLDDNILLGALSSSPSGIFSLAPIVAAINLSRCRYLVFRLDGVSGTFGLKRAVFSRIEAENTTQPLSAWLWDSKMPANSPLKLLERLKRHQISKLYMQINDDLEQFAPFIKEAAREGIAIWALDGSPDSVNDISPLLRRIEAVAAFNRNHPSSKFSGFQLDVEPYLLKDFSLKREEYSKKYLEMLNAANLHCRSGKFLLSAAVPFWFNQLPVNGRDLSWETVRRLDEVVVMGYRTDYSELLEITRTLLAAGEKLGKPVMLGVELMPVPDEHHDVLTMVPANSPGALLLGGVYWKKIRSYNVPGSRLSFALLRKELPILLKKIPPFSSFKGWVLHSVEGLEQLP